MKIKNLNTASVFLVASIHVAGLIGVTYNANATGNVLLPSNDSGNDNQLPNLGLVPQTKAPVQPSAAKPDTAASKQPGAAPSQSFIPPAVTVSVVPPSPETVSSTSGSNGAAAALLSKLAPTRETPLPSFQKPTITNSGTTTIIKISSPPSFPQLPAAFYKNMSRLGINISERSIWGPSDIMSISDKLGINKKQVTETCILSIRGIVVSSGAMSQFNTGTKGNDETHYNGNINNTYAQVFALCPANTTVPSGKGIISQIDDKYVIQIATGNCSPDKLATPSQLTILYVGNGQAQCGYQ